MTELNTTNSNGSLKKIVGGLMMLLVVAVATIVSMMNNALPAATVVAFGVYFATAGYAVITKRIKWSLLLTVEMAIPSAMLIVYLVLAGMQGFDLPVEATASKVPMGAAIVMLFWLAFASFPRLWERVTKSVTTES